MKKVALFLVLTGFLLSGCREIHRPELQQLSLQNVVKHDSDRGSWIFADLKGDGNDLIIHTDKSPKAPFGIFVSDQEGKILSQINLRYKVRGMKVLIDESTQSRWLFIGSNDQKQVMLSAFKYTWGTPLQREDIAFQPIPRTDRNIDRSDLEYNAMVFPELIADIDKDGRQELVCRMLDGFTANPRGLVVYDLASGLIKWRYDTSCNIHTVLFDDFDGNGSSEFILSTMALKNTAEAKNDLDDFHGNVFVLSASGQKLAQYQRFSDYGQIMLDAADTDQDGQTEIYSLAVTWGAGKHQNRLSVLHWDGKKLKMLRRRELSSTLERRQNIDFLLRRDGNAQYQVILVDKDKKLLVMDDELNEIKHNYDADISFIYEIQDLDRDGRKELLLETKDGNIEVLDCHFRRLTRLKNPFAESDSYNILLLNQSGDTAPYIAIGTSREINLYLLKPQSVGMMLWNILNHYAWVITIALLLITIILILINRNYDKYFRNGFNIPGISLIYVRKLSRIQLINPTAWALADTVNDPHCQDLRLSFPILYKLLKVFAESKPSSASIIGTVSDSHPTRYHITLMHVPSYIRTDLICFVPLAPEGDPEGDKTEWADTARRLSHHVRRHITNILLALEVMKSKEADANTNYQQIIRDEIEKVRIFTHSFQRFTELKNYELQLQDIIPSVEHCLSTCRIPANIKLLKNWNLTSVHARMEPIRFEEALQNVINNAIDAMPYGGTLQILVKEMPPSASHGNNINVLVEIEDTGSGIPPKYLEDIWKPFFTTKQSGTGIGIPESKKIIESMGGSMDIHSEEGVGTTVSFWLKGTAHE